MQVHARCFRILTTSLSFCLLGAAGCDDGGPRVFTAQLYDAEADCLGTYTPIGRVEAEDFPGDCAPTCLRLDSELYLSTLCGPYPDTTTLEPPDSETCAAALAALSAEAFCE